MSTFTPGFYVKIKFLDDQAVETVPITLIKEFISQTPENEDDYDKSTIYTCLWKDSKNPKIIELPVVIGAMKDLETNDDYEKFCNKRPSFTKLSDSIKDEYYDDTRETDTLKESHKMRQQKKKLHNKKKELDQLEQMNIIDKKLSTMNANIVDPEKEIENVVDNDQEIPIMKQASVRLENMKYPIDDEDGKIEASVEDQRILYLENKISTLKDKTKLLKQTKKEQKKMLDSLIEENNKMKKENETLLAKNKSINKKLEILRNLNEKLQMKIYDEESTVTRRKSTDNSGELHSIGTPKRTSTPVTRERKMESVKTKLVDKSPDSSNEETDGNQKLKLNTEREKKLNPNQYCLFEKFYITENGKKVKHVYLGDGVSYPHHEFDNMLTHKTASMVTKTMLRHIYNQAQLSRKACTDNKKNLTPTGKNKRTIITPEKREVLKRTARLYWKRKGVKVRSVLEAHVSKLNTYIGEEIKLAIRKEKSKMSIESGEGRIENKDESIEDKDEDGQRDAKRSRRSGSREIEEEEEI